MATNFKTNGQKGEYTICYRNMGGVDFSSESNSQSRLRFSHLENMYRDYEGDGGVMIESVPGFRKIASAKNGGPVHSIFSHRDNERRDHIIVHAGESLYRFALSERDEAGVLSPIASLKSNKSSAFNFENSLFILDGGDITIIDGEGKVTNTQSSPSLPYSPIRYINGEEYEQRNLLTNNFREKYDIIDCDSLLKESEGLQYEIISESNKTCGVNKARISRFIPVHIPATTVINGVEYKVERIFSYAFSGLNTITAVNIPEGVKVIEKDAFYGCTSLESVVVPNSVEEIGNTAFYNCSNLKNLNFGTGLKKIGENVTTNCPLLTEIAYPLDESTFKSITSETVFSAKILYNEDISPICVTIPIYTPTKSVTAVTVGGSNHSFGVAREGTVINTLVLYDRRRKNLDGKEVVISAVAYDVIFNSRSHGSNSICEHSVEGTEAIRGCTLSQSFDGRIFLSGNPKLPNTVFYSQRDSSGKNNPLYFGILNYFNDGIGTHEISALLATKDSLAVFKSTDDSSGSIYYHKPKETGDDMLPKIYPVSYTHNGISSRGGAISFYDEPIFLSKLGVVSINQSTYTGERNIEVRSHNVNPKLLSEPLENASLASWLGYLVVGFGEHLYLADSRQRFRHVSGDYEYEWYFINGAASYSGDESVYRYSDFAPAGYDLHKDCDQICRGTVISYFDSETGEMRYYSEEGDRRYSAYKCDERTGGVKHPMTALYSHGEELLFFGTENGDVCLFNNDKRGVAPSRLSEGEGFDEEEYRVSFGRRIHSDFYSFASHAPHYVLRTVMDNMNVPHLTKSTVKNSLTAKLRLYTKSDVSFDVKTDKSDYIELAKIPDTIPDFDELDFSAFSFVSSDYSTVAIKEKEKGWIEKQLQVSSDKFNSPFGLCSIAYRYTIKGRIKNT